MIEGVPGFLRYRVLKRQGLPALTENFETPGTTATSTRVWHSLGAETAQNLNYWTIDAGSPVMGANNQVTMPVGARMRGGHPDWKDITFQAMFDPMTGSVMGIEIHADASSNAVYLFYESSNGNLTLGKLVGGVYTALQGVHYPVTIDKTGYSSWLSLSCVGTTYTGSIGSMNRADGSYGGAGATLSISITDAALQSGRVGAFNGPIGGPTATGTGYFGSYTGGAIAQPNFPFICNVYAPGAVGWGVQDIAGEPAYAISTVSPYQGTSSASIYNANSSGSGAWVYLLGGAGTAVTVAGQVKATGGTANISAGGLATSNVTADSAYHALSVSGTLTGNPIVSLNASGAVATTYFDAVTVTPSGSVDITPNLVHPHKSSWTIKGMQPSQPASNAIGTFKLPLFPPGSEQYKANYQTYKQLLPGSGEGLRVEAYRGDVAGGAPVFSGIIAASTIDTANGGMFEVSGFTDTWVAAAQKFFPGELTSAATGTLNSVDRFTRYLGENVLAFADQFNPYTAANYSVTGAWVAGTDANGVNSSVVQITNPSGSFLTSNSGAPATLDGDHAHLVEVLCRFATSGNLIVGVGLTSNVARTGYNTVGAAYLNVNGIDLDAGAGPFNNTTTTTQALKSVIDADGFVTVHLQLLVTSSQVTLSVNGSAVVQTTSDPSATLLFPYLYATGTGTVYFTNLIHGIRSTAKTNTTSAPFIAGTTGSPVHSLMSKQPPYPSLLDGWSACATVEGWYWRYNPVTMGTGPGTHPTMGSVDIGASPGTDRSASVRFVEGDNLVNVKVAGNADAFGSDLQFNGNSATNSGGVSSARNIPAMQNYGWLTNVGMSLAATEYNAFRLQANGIVGSMGGPGASITATVLRDPATADVWRELDTVTIHAPSIGLINSKGLVLAYTYTEGEAFQTITVGQFGATDVALAGKKFSANAVLMAGLFKSR